ncbi:MAG: FAD-dependent oxidoreductase [Candidatus Eisenbacteria bacterium]|nr:FAD-dependent oxidoreductase [Candidatus Eisenbacteria bacterium]
MTVPGAPDHPLRVAIIGSGPAAFYAAEHLLKAADRTVEVEMIDRLPTPYGLVRGGVAPDHQKIKSVIAIYEKIAAHPRFRFFGNVEFGRDLTRADLTRHVHAVIYATGAQTDRALGIPGEDLVGSHSATEFVAWYNGHPDFRDRRFDLTVERVAVIGVGNVAIDVARILCLLPDELRTTDMADYAIEALSVSRVREVSILGRRGPVQAAFTTVEVKELGELPGADVIVRADEIALDPASAEELAAARAATKAKVEILEGFAKRAPAGKPRRLHIRFLVSPVEIVGDEKGRVAALRVAKNRLVKDAAGALVAEPRLATDLDRGTGETETLPVGMVFRSVGYRGVPLDGVPFDAKRGLIPNAKGRVLDPAAGEPIAGQYASGWIKRGPSGVIGNNRADSVETVNALLEDAAAGRLPEPAEPAAAAFAALMAARRPECVTFADWRRLDAIEVERGKPLGRPRNKLTSVAEMLAALDPTRTP